MSDGLGVDVVDFETAVVGVRDFMAGGEADDEERVVVDELVAAVDVGEHADVGGFTVAVVGVEDVGRD